MVWGLAWRCCIRRRVKKLSRRAAKLIAAFMADPPSAARAAASPRALVPDRLPNTTACLRRGRGRGKRTGRAIEPRDPHRLDTIARARLSQSDGAYHADAGHDCLIFLGCRSVGTKYRMFDEHLRCPSGFPRWRGTGRRKQPDLPNGVDAWPCSLPALCRSRHAVAPGDSCRTWCRGLSTPSLLDQRLEVRGCVLPRDANPRRSATQIDSSRSRAAALRVHNDTAC